MNMQRAPKLQWLKFSAMLLILGAFISILIYVLVARDELVATNADVPLITPAETPIKRRPENPGGLDIPNRDRVVFDLLSNPENNVAVADTQATAEPEVLALTLTDTTPEPAPVVSAPEKSPEPQPAVVEATQKAEAKPAPQEPAKQPTSDAITALLTEPAAPQEPEGKPKAEKPSGKYGVQLASFALRQDAENAAQNYKKKHASLLGNYTADIQRADLGAKGVRYRVRFVGQETRTDANALCKSLKTAGQGCLAVNK